MAKTLIEQVKAMPKEEGINRMFQSARWCEEKGFLKKGVLEKYRQDSRMLKKICFEALIMESAWIEKQQAKGQM
ncbi:MAG: hypothetical protein PUE35_06210 [Bacteroidales bacterium]|nr:hypothetical protein [Bacteroidales bacterium]